MLSAYSYIFVCNVKCLVDDIQLCLKHLLTGCWNLPVLLDRDRKFVLLLEMHFMVTFGGNEIILSFVV